MTVTQNKKRKPRGFRFLFYGLSAFQSLELEARAELHLERLTRIVIEQKLAEPR